MGSSSSSSSGAGLPGGDTELDEDRLDLEITAYVKHICTAKDSILEINVNC